jgi:hypothetical protein
VLVLSTLTPEKMFLLGIITLAIGVLITLAGVQYQNVGVMLCGTVVGGVGFGSVFSGTLRSVLPYAEPGERAGLLSAITSRATFPSVCRRSPRASSRPSLV